MSNKSLKKDAAKRPPHLLAQALSIKMIAQEKITSIIEAHRQSFEQTILLHLIASYISDIRNDRANLTNLEHRVVKIAGYLIYGHTIQDVAREIRFNKRSESLLYHIEKNFCLGTISPLYEVTKDNEVKRLINDFIFVDDKTTETFISLIAVCRHIFAHNYTQMLKLRSHDFGREIKAMKKSHDKLIIVYDGQKYFPSAYSKPFTHEIILDLNNLQEGSSFYKAISHKSLLFLGEFCNNILFKIIEVVTKLKW